MEIHALKTVPKQNISSFLNQQAAQKLMWNIARQNALKNQ